MELSHTVLDGEDTVTNAGGVSEAVNVTVTSAEALSSIVFID